MKLMAPHGEGHTTTSQLFANNENNETMCLKLTRTESHFVLKTCRLALKRMAAMALSHFELLANFLRPTRAARSLTRN